MTLSRTRHHASNTNEEWPEIINREVLKVKTETEPPEPKKIRLGSVGTEDLKDLKKKDSFLYYSIPGVRSAALLGQGIDSTNLGFSRIRSRPLRNTVARSRRIAFEGHPFLLINILSATAADENDQDSSFDTHDATMEALGSKFEQ